MIINETKIREEIEAGRTYNNINKILKKAAEGNGLTTIETSSLMQNLDSKKLPKGLEIAAELKFKLKGNVFSAYSCLYTSNVCKKNCKHCGFRESNSDLERITLTSAEIRNEAIAMRDAGLTNVILISGTVPEEQYKKLIIEGTKSVKDLGLNPWIEFENLSLKTLRDIKKAGADHFVLFQETYNRKKYARIFSNTSLKQDYDARLRKPDEAFEAGFSNIGIGALFGLNGADVFEVLGLYHHTQHLKNKGARVCISAPTLKPAPGLSISSNRVSDEEVAKIYTVLRLALPNVSLALSGRERINLRNRLFPIIDQIGSGGVPNPGGRTIYKEAYLKGDTQFRLYDTRSTQEVTQYLANMGIEVKYQVNWNNKP